MSSSGTRSLSQEGILNTPLHGIYIPCALLIVGTAIVKREWLLYSVVLAVWLSALKVLRGRPRTVLHPTEYRRFELQSKTVITHNTAIYRFALPRSSDKLGLPVGQHISIAATINDKEIVRSYTPVSSDEVDRGYFDLLIKSYPTGNISKFIAGLRVGQSISVKGPKGQMIYQRGLVKAFGMIAGGSGITPMLQIVRAILRDPKDNTRVDLIFANVNEEDILLRDDLDELAAQHEQFNVHYVLNNPPEGWTGGVGFVTSEMIKEHCPPPEMGKDAKILICGPPPMVSAMKKATASLGYEAAKPVSKLEHQVFAF